jgi:hypothetical protein
VIGDRVHYGAVFSVTHAASLPLVDRLLQGALELRAMAPPGTDVARECVQQRRAASRDDVIVEEDDDNRLSEALLAEAGGERDVHGDEGLSIAEVMEAVDRPEKPLSIRPRR